MCEKKTKREGEKKRRKKERSLLCPFSFIYLFFCFRVTKEVKERVPITLKRLFNDGSTWFLLIAFLFVFFLVTNGGRWKTKRVSIESVAVRRNMGNLSVRTTTTVTTTTTKKNSDLRFFHVLVACPTEKKKTITHIKKKAHDTEKKKKGWGHTHKSWKNERLQNWERKRREVGKKALEGERKNGHSKNKNEVVKPVLD